MKDEIVVLGFSLKRCCSSCSEFIKIVAVVVTISIICHRIIHTHCWWWWWVVKEKKSCVCVSNEKPRMTYVRMRVAYLPTVLTV